MFELPIVQRAQRQRQTGRLGKDALVIAKQPRPPQHVDQLLVLIVILNHSTVNISKAESESTLVSSMSASRMRGQTEPNSSRALPGEVVKRFRKKFTSRKNNLGSSR